MKVDVLAFGAHPDDVELGCGGTLFIEKMQGKKTGIIDLTEGEMGTRGTVESRKKESDLAAEILQLDCRENLKLADGFFQNNEECQRKVIYAIRKYRPEIILCNAPEDRHPDHGKGAALVSDAAFLAGLRKIETFDNGVPQEAWRPKQVFHYIQDRYLDPNFVIDITDAMEKKLESIKAHSSQFFDPNSNEPSTYISSPHFLDSIVYRAKMFGKMIGTTYAEGFISKKMLGYSNFNAFILKDT